MVVTNTSQRINPKKSSLKPYILRVWDCITSIFVRKLDRGFKETLQKKSPLGSLEESFFHHMISVNLLLLTNSLKIFCIKTARINDTKCFSCSGAQQDNWTINRATNVKEIIHSFPTKVKDSCTNLYMSIVLKSRYNTSSKFKDIIMDCLLEPVIDITKSSNLNTTQKQIFYSLVCLTNLKNNVPISDQAIKDHSGLDIQNIRRELTPIQKNSFITVEQNDKATNDTTDCKRRISIHKNVKRKLAEAIKRKSLEEVDERTLGFVKRVIYLADKNLAMFFAKQFIYETCFCYLPILVIEGAINYLLATDFIEEVNCIVDGKPCSCVVTLDSSWNKSGPLVTSINEVHNFYWGNLFDVINSEYPPKKKLNISKKPNNQIMMVVGDNIGVVQNKSIICNAHSLDYKQALGDLVVNTQDLSTPTPTPYGTCFLALIKHLGHKTIIKPLGVHA